ncbi:hypothetical protein CLOSBL3_11625 [Clostridiaceae bacterium BL-3]|nr:hypothetical protein CLOSBL3_11625 [Clostridiaceae bacterium BL-3]
MHFLMSHKPPLEFNFKKNVANYQHTIVYNRGFLCYNLKVF